MLKQRFHCIVKLHNINTNRLLDLLYDIKTLKFIISRGFLGLFYNGEGVVERCFVGIRVNHSFLFVQGLKYLNIISTMCYNYNNAAPTYWNGLFCWPPPPCECP